MHYRVCNTNSGVTGNSREGEEKRGVTSIFTIESWGGGKENGRKRRRLEVAIDQVVSFFLSAPPYLTNNGGKQREDAIRSRKVLSFKKCEPIEGSSEAFVAQD